MELYIIAGPNGVGKTTFAGSSFPSMRIVRISSMPI